MKLKIVCISNNSITTDELNSSAFMDPRSAAAQIKRLYEGAGIEVLDILKVEESETSINAS